MAQANRAAALAPTFLGMAAARLLHERLASESGLSAEAVLAILGAAAVPAGDGLDKLLVDNVNQITLVNINKSNNGSLVGKGDHLDNFFDYFLANPTEGIHYARPPR